MTKEPSFDTELFISWSLKIGVYLAATVIVIGLVLFFATGNSGYAPGKFPTTLAQVFSGVSVLKPGAITSLGLLLLILTPVFRVAASVFLFLFERDYLYTVITLIVLVILLFSLFFGRAI